MRLYNKICCGSRVTMTIILCSDDAGILEGALQGFGVSPREIGVNYPGVLCCSQPSWGLLLLPARPVLRVSPVWGSNGAAARSWCLGNVAFVNIWDRV